MSWNLFLNNIKSICYTNSRQNWRVFSCNNIKNQNLTCLWWNIFWHWTDLRWNIHNTIVPFLTQHKKAFSFLAQGWLSWLACCRSLWRDALAPQLTALSHIMETTLVYEAGGYSNQSHSVGNQPTHPLWEVMNIPENIELLLFHFSCQFE